MKNEQVCTYSYWVLLFAKFASCPENTQTLIICYVHIIHIVIRNNEKCITTTIAGITCESSTRRPL